MLGSTTITQKLLVPKHHRRESKIFTFNVPLERVDNTSKQDFEQLSSADERARINLKISNSYADVLSAAGKIKALIQSINGLKKDEPLDLNNLFMMRQHNKQFQALLNQRECLIKELFKCELNELLKKYNIETDIRIDQMMIENVFISKKRHLVSHEVKYVTQKEADLRYCQLQGLCEVDAKLQRAYMAVKAADLASSQWSDLLKTCPAAERQAIGKKWFSLSVVHASLLESRWRLLQMYRERIETFFCWSQQVITLAKAGKAVSQNSLSTNIESGFFAPQAKATPSPKRLEIEIPESAMGVIEPCSP